jgi:UPF0716 protein FxsA
MCGPIIFSTVTLMAVELFLLIEAGGTLGGMNTVGLVVFTGTVGLYVVQNQGLDAVRRLQTQRAVPSSADLVEGPLLIVAALCLLLPGFVTDGVGACLLVPPLRRWVARRIVARFGGGHGPGSSGGQLDDDTVIVVKRRRPQ